MCGIIAASTERSIGKLLIQGLYKMEYRGYDSAGIAMHTENKVAHLRTLGKVNLLEDLMINEKPKGKVGIAHTRWATHGEPSEVNAHPHQSNERIFIVHNGIIENYLELKDELANKGYAFTSKTDSELIAHLLDSYLEAGSSLLEATKQLKDRLQGAYAIAALDHSDPNTLVLARHRSPLLIGLGEDENFAASDPLALADLTNKFLILEDGDVAKISPSKVEVFDKNNKACTRNIQIIDIKSEASSKGDYKHFMEKEIYEQPNAILNTLDGRVGGDDVLENIFGEGSNDLFAKVKRIQITACGTSLHAGRVAANWFSAIAGLPTQIDYASEYRYKNPYVDENTLLVTISQSGETADTLAALRYAKDQNYLASLAICNVPTSSLARESDFLLLTNAGPEIGVASTKAFTTQLTALMLLTLSLAKASGTNPRLRARVIQALRQMPEIVKKSIELKDDIVDIASEIAQQDNALFLGRGMFYPIAKEGALKLKEISYIHAEGYASGELKHGPIALIDDSVPVIILAPYDNLFEKSISNMQEVIARKANVIVISDNDGLRAAGLKSETSIEIPKADALLAPFVYALPIQLLAYFTAVFKGTDVDQPRNLAKSVTVE